MSSPAIRRSALATTALAAIGLFSAPAQSAQCNWTGGAGSWYTGTSWSCGTAPGSGDDAVITAGGSVVTISGGTATAATINLGAGNSLTDTSGATLYIYNNALTNNGTITVTNNSDFQKTGAGTVAVTGTGTIILNTGDARLFGGSWNFGSGQTISGVGQLGVNQTTFSNAGLISANVSNGTFTIDVSAGNGGVGAGNGVGTNGNAGAYNTGIMQATNGGTLLFNGGLYENSSAGIIRANTGSTVSFGGDVRIVGGTLTTTGTGVINTVGGDAHLQNVTLSTGSTLTSTNNSYLYLNSHFTNNGQVNIGGNTYMVSEASPLSIDGTGTITMSNALIYGGTITFGSGQTIDGVGNLGANQTTMVINGKVSADVSGGTLQIDPSAGNGGVGAGNGVGTNTNSGLLNNGTLQAVNGGTLLLGGGLYENASNGVIQALDGSTVSFGGDMRIVGGTLTTVGSGVMNTVGGDAHLQNVTLSAGSTLTSTNNSYLYLNTTFTNNGQVNIGGNTYMVSEASPLLIGGTGTITMSNAQIFGGNITFGSGQTIDGVGNLGSNQTTMVINGKVSADVNGGTLVIDPSAGNGGTGTGNGVGTNTNSGLLNNGTLQAVNGGILALGGGLYENASNGVIQALDGSSVNLNGDVRILGGTLTTAGTGSINVSGGNFLNSVTLSSGSHINATTNDTLVLDTSFVNNGSVAIGGGTYLQNQTGPLSITGTGTITMSNAQIFGGNITFGSGQTIDGVGNLGSNQTTMVVNGTVSADVNGGTLTIDSAAGNGGTGTGNGVGTATNSGLLNNGTLQAVNGGILGFNGGLYENASTGVIQALDGSSVNLNGDVRILGGTLTSVGSGSINLAGTNVLQNVTLSSGSHLNATTNDNFYLNNSFVNNGTVALDNGTYLLNETGTLSITGTGIITVGNAQIFGGAITIGNGQLIVGQGNIGANQTIISNSGNILASGGTMVVDPAGGNGGVGAGSGFGTGGIAAFYNDNGGQLQADNGGNTLQLQGGLYEQAAGGSFSVGTNSNFTMTGDTSLANLQTGGVLSKGLYFAFGGGTMSLTSNQTGSIVTIGTNHAGTDTQVSLTGAGSVIQVTPTGGGNATTIDASLQAIAQSGELTIAGGRVFTAAGAISNAGVLNLQNGTFTAPGGYTNSGTTTGNGTVGTPITNTGTVVADGGTLHSQAITGTTGTVQSNAGATLDLSGATAASTAGFLTNNGSLNLGTNTITVTSDYQNASFGSGNSFNAHGNVTVSGAGAINAASATMDLSGSGLTGDTLNVGNVRLGNSSSTTLTITNNGTLTTLRGAVESPVTNTVSISSSNFVVGPNGGSTQVTLSYTGTTAGSLQGNTITVANNFDNVADRTLTITGAAYNPAAATLSPNPIDLGATRQGMGTLSGMVTIANTAPTGAYTEKLAVTSATGSGAATGTAPSGLIAAGSSAGSAVTLSNATSGNISGSVTYGLATDGTGTSGLAQMALASQTVQVNGRVYQTANAQLASTTVDFGTVRQGAGSTSATLGVTNTANGALNDNLNTSIGSLPAGVTGTAPGALAGGASGNASFSHSNATAGTVSGTGTLNFTSTDAELDPLALASQSVSFKGTVTQLSIVDLFKNSGAGTFSGAGSSYTLNLGSFTGTGSATSNLGVSNDNAGASYSETLGGTFSGASMNGYTFNGMTFSGLAGGQQDINNLLTFDYSGLADGTYTDVLTFNGYSHYDGLTDYTFGPITVNVTATVSGNGGMTGAVPEPTTWAMVIIGFGIAGGALRRRRLATPRRSVA